METKVIEIIRHKATEYRHRYGRHRYHDTYAKREYCYHGTYNYYDHEVITRKTNAHLRIGSVDVYVSYRNIATEQQSIGEIRLLCFSKPFPFINIFKIKINDDNLNEEYPDCFYRSSVVNFDDKNEDIYRILGITIPQIHTVIKDIRDYDLQSRRRKSMKIKGM